MDDKNTTNNTPDVEQDFTKSTDAVPEPEKFEQIPGKIATQTELKMRSDNRQEPVLESHLTIGGEVEKTVHQKDFEENERMIEYLEYRLERTDLTEDFERSR